MNKYIVAIVATGLSAGVAMAAYGPAPKTAKGCGFESSAADKFGNAVRSGAKGVCWQDRIKLSGVVQGRYTYTDQSNIKELDLDNQLKLNAASLILDANLNSKWSAHFSLTDIKGTESDSAALGDHLRADEAMLYYNNGGSNMYFKAGYGFANFGEYNNPYEFLRSPTDVAATNLDTQAGVGFAQDGMFAEVYAIGTTDTSWGAAFGYDGRLGEVGLHTKVAYVENENLSSITASEGGTYDVEVEAVVPGGFALGGAYVKTRGIGATETPVKLWSVNAKYKFNAGGMKSEVHGWYAKNDETSANSLVTTPSTTGTRFNPMLYNTQYLDNIWSVGFGADLSENVSFSVDYVSSDGESSADPFNSLADSADYNLWNVTLTGRF